MKIDVGPNIVEPIVRDQVAAAVAAHLGDPTDLIRKLVTAALSTKVNAHGVRSNNRYENKYDFMEVLAGNAIREAAKAALLKIVEEQQPEIEAAIQDELRRRPEKTAAAMVSAFAEGCSKNYRTTFNFDFTKEN